MHFKNRFDRNQAKVEIIVIEFEPRFEFEPRWELLRLWSQIHLGG